MAGVHAEGHSGGGCSGWFVGAARVGVEQQSNPRLRILGRFFGSFRL
jgi:hypothetical protein